MVDSVGCSRSTGGSTDCGGGVGSDRSSIGRVVIMASHCMFFFVCLSQSGLRVRMPVVVPEPMPLVASSTLWSVPANTRSIVHTELKVQCNNDNNN